MLARAAAAAARGLRPRARGVTHLAPGGEWLALDTSAAPDVDTVTVALGLSNSALDVIGDVRAIRWSATPGPHAAHAPVAELDWEGFTRTASDELYHAVWANAVGVRRVSSPLAGQLLAVNDAVQPSQLDETTWLARLRVRRSAWDAATNAWRAEAERRRTERR